jgi:hypothetical protein
MEEATMMVLKLFRAMDDHEKKETILALGEEIESTGLVNRLVPERVREREVSLAPRRRASGKKGKRPYWVRRVTGLDKSQKGAMQLEGEWLDGADFTGHEPGDLVVVGFRWPKRTYYLLEVRPGHGRSAVLGEPDVELAVQDVEVVERGSFKNIMLALEVRFGVDA